MRYNAVDEHAQWNADFDSAKAQLQSQHMQAQSGMGPLRDLGNKQELAHKRPPELPVVADVLGQRVSVLGNVIADLEKRLTPVLRLQPPSPATSPNQATQDYGATTQLGGIISQATGNIDVAINRVRDLLDRLEL